MNVSSFIRALPIAVLTLAALIPALAAPPAAAKPVWAADAKVAAQLGEPAKVGDFQWRIPKGYTAVAVPGAPAPAQILTWAGTKRADGTAPMLLAMIITVPPGETAMPPLTVALKGLLTGVAKRRDQWQETAAETGTIAGLEFCRSRWHGTDKETGRKMHGFMYVAVVGTQLLQLSSQDVEPHHETALKLAEAAVLSFRRQ